MAKQLLCVYHSQSGAVAQLCSAFWQGAQTEAAVITRVGRAVDVASADWRSADAVVLAFAENSGHVAGGMKEMLDRVFYPLQTMPPKALAIIVSAGNDGSNALREVQRIAKGLPLRLVAEPIVIKGEPDSTAEHACFELGQSMAMGLEMGIF